MEEIKNIEQKDYILLKELITKNEKIIARNIHDFQNKLISFCKDTNNLQTKSNFFYLTMQEQFNFNECIEHVGLSLKKDFRQIEGFYTSCRDKCLSDNPQHAKEIEASIESYISSSVNIFRPELHPCVYDCVEIYNFLNNKYYNYMINQEGLYIEYIDYKKMIKDEFIY